SSVSYNKNQNKHISIQYIGVFTNKHYFKYGVIMKSMSVEDVITYQVFIKSKNFSTLLKMAIDKYCTDLDKNTELQELLLQKPKELIEKYEKDDKISTIALALGISNIV